MKNILWISNRLRLRSGKKGGSGTTGVVIAVAGVALALMVMELTLAVVTGFKREITEKLRGFDADVCILPAYDYATGKSEAFISRTAFLDSVADGASLAMRLPGMLKTDDNFAAMMYVGWDCAHDDTFERGNIVAGEWPDFGAEESGNKIVVSRATSLALGVGVGDKVFSCYFIDGGIKTRRHEVAGIYDSNFGEYDRTVVYGSLAALQRIAGVDSVTGSQLELRGIPLENVGEASQSLQDVLVEAYQYGRVELLYPVSDINRTGVIYLNWLELLDTNVAVIFILMLCVAAFTLVSSLFIIVLERVRTIGVLRALGATRGAVRRVFVYMALRLAGLGIVIGNVVGVGLIFLQGSTHVLPLDPEMYYLDHVPVVFEPWSLILLNAGVLAVCWAVLIIPAAFASRLDPAATMRYE